MMRLLPTLYSLALSVALTSAFADTSPFFFLSTASLPPTTVPQLTSATSLLHTLHTHLHTCPSDAYVLISQPGVNAVDYASSRAAPGLSSRLSRIEGHGGEDVKTSFQVKDVIGQVDLDVVQDLLEDKCGAKVLKIDASTGSFQRITDPSPRVIRVDFPTLSTSSKSERAAHLFQHDAFLNSLLSLLPSPKNTVLYTTTPISPDSLSILDGEPAQNDQPSPEEAFLGDTTHRELKRDMGQGYTTSNSSSDGDGARLKDGPLFERYQFFTPGLFMGLLVTFLLLSLLYVGVSGVASLQIPYAAFDKEMGPGGSTGQGKKQQ
ncbi:MAG: hypothetical protein M1817_001814 [Caeruleum heppii]|nr:MAG: hypothetical protein M1817_001814 [Caeruleum heppii]